VLDHAWLCDRAEEEVSAFAAVVADAPDVAAEVPSCPGWSFADLTRHTGTIHRWVTDIVLTQATARTSFPEVTPPDESAEGWGKWLTSGGEPLLAALRAAGPLTPVWSWGPGRTSGWWARRMLHETTVHRADAELARGADPVIDPVVAADGIDEFLFNLPSARRPYRHLASLPTGASLHLQATDAGSSQWLIRFTDSGIAWERGPGRATTVIRGPLTSLLLFTCGRRPASDPRLAVRGDESVPAAWQEKTAQ
jgi:uncharacterized protein (TIGR03083 family)